MFSRKTYVVPISDSRSLHLGEHTVVMGVINATPDSFADKKRNIDSERLVEIGLRMASEGAEIIDVGGESTRPGAEPVSVDEELARVLPVIRCLAQRTRVLISIDTYKASVAEAALDAGATIVNDVSGLHYDRSLARVVAKCEAGLVLVHNRGRSREMYREAVYDDLVSEIIAELHDSVRLATEAGVPKSKIILDPGLGFAKRPEHSFEVIANLEALTKLDRPLLVGPSRKSFMASTLGQCPPEERDWGTASAVTAAVLVGAHIVRVHTVRPMVDVVRVADEIQQHRIGNI